MTFKQPLDAQIITNAVEGSMAVDMRPYSVVESTGLFGQCVWAPLERAFVPPLYKQEKAAVVSGIINCTGSHTHLLMDL